MPWRDRLIGVALGLVLGIGVVVLFVFVYSERTVDAPSISRGAGSDGQGRHGEGRGSQAPGGRRSPVAMVRVVGGAPPSSGPPAFHFRKGEKVRLRVASDETLRLELLGYG